MKKKNFKNLDENKRSEKNIDENKRTAKILIYGNINL